jgi:hypothetical protein
VSKKGRPTKFKKGFIKQAEKLCKLGATDKDLAGFFEVCEDTINEWKIRYKAFSESLYRGKDYYDSQLIENALKSRAIGYSHQEIKFFAHEGIVTDQREIIKHYPPDTKAIELWLNNRNSDRWQNKQKVDFDGELTINAVQWGKPKNE